MQKRILLITATALLFSFINWGCSKLDTTDIGSDLLPAVDNVNTFDILLAINATQGIYNPDTTKLQKTDDYVLGKISDDALFGQTTANIFLQLKPAFFPFYYGNANDTITNFDSAVLCLSYKGFWGDSMPPIQLQVKEINNNFQNNGLWDSIYAVQDINYAPANLGAILGSASVDVKRLGDTVKYSKKGIYGINQVRIKLSTAFLNKIKAFDSVSNNPFRSDSLFKAATNGLAVLATGGSGLMYCNIADTSTKLEIHYRYKNGGATDTAYTSFKLNSSTFGTATVTPSATANNIIRNRSGYPISNPASTDIYLQTTPGSYANLIIPQLDTLSNRIVHKAEIIIEQIPDALNKIYTAPGFLYLDLKDTGTTVKWKPVYFDLNPAAAYNPDNLTSFFPGNGIDFLYYGGYVRNKTDQFGNAIKYYNFNITRHIQQIVTKHTTNYQLRLFAPYEVKYPQYSPQSIPFNNRLAYGRVKVGSGTNANYRMRLRIIYSKI